MTTGPRGRPRKDAAKAAPTADAALASCLERTLARVHELSAPAEG